MAVPLSEMGIRLSDTAHRYIAAFSELTGIVPSDCLVEDPLTFVIPPDDMAEAIGPHGETVAAVEEEFDTQVVLIADAASPESFIANALEPAVVESVTIEEADDETIAHAIVDDRDMGVAIGTEGARIDRARRLASRHFSLDDITLHAASDEACGKRRS